MGRQSVVYDAVVDATHQAIREIKEQTMTNAICNHPECDDGAQLGQYCRACAPLHPYAMIDLIDTLATDVGDARMALHNHRRTFDPVVVDGENWWRKLPII